MRLLPSVCLPFALLGSVAAQGYLGVTLESSPPPTVRTVEPNTPAARADLRTGDQFLAVGGEETPTVDVFIDAVRGHAPGDEVRFDIERDGRKLSKDIVLAERPPQIEEPVPAEEPEEEVEEQEREEAPPAREPQEEARERGRLRPRAQGEEEPAEELGEQAGRGATLGVEVLENDLTVTRVLEGGAAAEAGVQVGDRIVGLGRARRLDDMDALRDALARLRPGQTVRLRVERGDTTETLSLTLGGPGTRAEAEREGVAEAIEPEARAERRRAAEEERREARRAAETARTERRRAAAASEGEGGARELAELREELSKLRQEIAELKELVRKLGRD